jgi:hypothetical protein
MSFEAVLWKFKIIFAPLSLSALTGEASCRQEFDARQHAAHYQRAVKRTNSMSCFSDGLKDFAEL